MAAAAPPIEALPPELITHIFYFLDSPAPSDVRLRDQPSPSMLASADAPLKAVSLVSSQWRAIVLPRLFRHVLWAFDRWTLVFSETCATASNTGAFDAAGNPTNLPLLNFIRDNGLGRFVESLTLIVGDRMYGQYRLAEAGAAGSSNAKSTSLAQDPRDEMPEDEMRSLLTNARSRAGWTSGWRQHSARSEDSNWLWKMLFEAMDPKRFTIIALPRMLASLLSRMLFLGDAWSFRDQCHILSLDRRTPESLEKWRPSIPQTGSDRAPSDGNDKTRATLTTDQGSSASESASSSKHPAGLSAKPPYASDPAKPVKTILFTIRPWTSVLLNEGSSTRVYKTYEFFLKRPPSILGSLLGCEESPNNESLIPPSVRSFSYIAIFPLSSHFNSLVNHLPQIDSLYLQLVPRNDILDNKDEMAHIQTQDLWMERNTCYSLVMRALFGAEMGLGWDDEDGAEPENGWGALKVFESGDAADKEAWDMAVEYVRMSGTSWKVVADGVLIKDAKRRRRRSDSEDSFDGDIAPSDAATFGDDDDDPEEGFELLSVPLSFEWIFISDQPGSTPHPPELGSDDGGVIPFSEPYNEF